MNKLATRKNQRSVCAATRPRSGGKNAQLPRRNPPIRVSWEVSIRRTQPGSPIFPTLQNQNITRALRVVRSKMEGPEAKRYATHCFHLGAAAAIRRSVSTLSEIMRTGGAESYAFRVYPEIQKEEGCSAKAAIAMDSPDSSPPGIPKLPRGKYS